MTARGLTALIKAQSSALPAAMRASLAVLVSMLLQLEEKIAELDAEIARRAREDETARRLMTIPGIGPLIATALATLAPPPEMFRRGRDFAAWVGLTPRQHSTGGKQRLGATTRMGERSLRRLLIIGANSVGSPVRASITKSAYGAARAASGKSASPRASMITAHAWDMHRQMGAKMCVTAYCLVPDVAGLFLICSTIA